MNKPLENTAVLLFARSAEAEVQAKRVLPNARAGTNCRLWHELNSYAAQTARNAGMPVFHVSETEQFGSTFGARLQHAFAQVFALGFKRVLAIGNDCMQLTPAALRKAASQAPTKAVLGPARDGGVYLLGLTQAQFRTLPFNAISWQSNRVLGELQACLQHTALLQTLSDIDSAGDLCRVLLSATVPQSLLRALRDLLPGNPAHYTLTREEPLPVEQASDQHPRRGPPFFA